MTRNILENNLFSGQDARTVVSSIRESNFIVPVLGRKYRTLVKRFIEQQEKRLEPREVKVRPVSRRLKVRTIRRTTALLTKTYAVSLEAKRGMVGELEDVSSIGLELSMEKGELYEDPELTPDASSKLKKLLSLYADEWRAGHREVVSPSDADGELESLANEAKATLRAMKLNNN